MLALFRPIGFGHVTIHGFRSTFKDLVTETTEFADYPSEMALAHRIRDKAQAAYKRGRMLEKRRALMGAWQRFCYPSHNDE